MSKSLFATENLLENTDGVGAPRRRVSLGSGSLAPSVYADGRPPDDVIVSKATHLVAPTEYASGVSGANEMSNAIPAEFFNVSMTGSGMYGQKLQLTVNTQPDTIPFDTDQFRELSLPTGGGGIVLQIHPRGEEPTPESSGAHLAAGLRHSVALTQSNIERAGRNLLSNRESAREH